MRASLLLIFIAVFSFTPFVGKAEIPQIISYQGKVTDSGGTAVPDGSYDMEFRLYNQQSGGSALWSSGSLSISIESGIFNIILGEGTPINLDFAEDYWLEVEIESDIQSPRQPLGSVGYSFMTSGIVPGTLIEGSVSSGTLAALKGVNTATTGTTYGGKFHSSSTSGRACYGWATATSGTTYGGAFKSSSPNGYGLWAKAEATSGDNRGIYGESASDAGIGIFGKATATTGTTYGVRGWSEATHGVGVEGRANATTGNTWGVYGWSKSIDGKGVQGYASATAGESYGVFGEAKSALGAGVFGTAPTYGVFGKGTLTTGNTYGGCFSVGPDHSGGYGAGVLGRNESSEGNDNYGGLFMSFGATGSGVKGWAVESTGINYGVYGTSDSDQGRGVYGEAATYGIEGQATATTGSTYGGYFTSTSSSGRGIFGEGEDYGIHAVSTGASGTGYGGYFTCASTSGRAVAGDATATSGTTYGGKFHSESTAGRGCYGWATSTSGTTYGGAFKSSSPDGYGVWGKAEATTGTNFGVYGESSSGNGYGLYGLATASGGIGVYGKGGSSGYAADFEGNVRIRSRSDGSTIMELGEGLDYAEGFDVSEPGTIDPGTVLIIDSGQPGKLTLSTKSYDNRVAGIVAGANGLGSGVRLGVDHFDYDVALAGRVYCNVDATTSSIEPGDLLTTSDLPGFAMKAIDTHRSSGAILGKAMESLELGGRGQILVLVTLQ